MLVAFRVSGRDTCPTIDLRRVHARPRLGNATRRLAATQVPELGAGVLHSRSRAGGTLAKLPSLQFYPGDWRKDPGVQALDYFTRGVWFEILLLMFESDERGKLMLNGSPMPDGALSKLLGLSESQAKRAVDKLLEYGVASKEPETGTLVCRRMVRDERLRNIRKECGRLGGNPNLVNQTANQNESPPVNQIPTPSSSSSSSISSSPSKTERGASAPARSKRKPATRLPDDFIVTLQMREWAERNVPTVNVDAETEKFLDNVEAKDIRFVSWVAGWRTWMRRAPEYAPRGGNGAGREKTSKELADQVIRKLEKYGRV